MKREGRWRYAPLGLVAVVGISGIVEAWPHAAESAGDLLIDAGILAAVVAVSILLARRFGKRGAKTG